MAVTPEVIAEYLRIPAGERADAQDDLVEVTAAAIEHVETLCGPHADDDTRTLTVRASGSSVLLPVTRLSAVLEVRRPDGTVVDVDPVDVDLLAGILVLRDPTPGDWQVDVAFTGRAASLTLAVKIIASHLWETRRGTADPARRRLYANGDAREPVRSVPIGVAIPSRASQLMAPYVVPGFA